MRGLKQAISKAPFTNLSPVLLGWLLGSGLIKNGLVLVLRGCFRCPDARLPHICIPSLPLSPSASMAGGSREQGLLELPVKLFRSAGQAHTLCCPFPPGLLQGGLKVPFPCCQCLGHRDPGGGDFSRRGFGARTWLVTCSEQAEGLALNHYSHRCC